LRGAGVSPREDAMSDESDDRDEERKQDEKLQYARDLARIDDPDELEDDEIDELDEED
jgi:hypothetical protein